ncbi:OmpA family protein [Piscinibacter sp.]|uniref:OmpA family protein n=1 Tax=Piscinibacter sp. TaxID=1903157 RepID=UPI0039E2500F
MLTTPRILGAALLLLLGACSLPKTTAPPVPPPVAAAPQPAAPAGAWVWSGPLESAGTRLRGSLGGAAEVSQTSDQRLWIALPVETAFAAGRSAVTPAAGAWLDQIAAALRGLPRAQVQIVGPADPRGGGQNLAVDRAASARDWMVMRGVPPPRMAVSGPAARGRGVAADGRLHILVGERGAP